MFLRNSGRLLVVVGLVLLITSAAASRPRQRQRLHTGSWGGPHIRIEVGPGSANIEYDCADGTINGPLTMDTKGSFSWRGTHSSGRHGPIRVGQKPSSQPAIYTGSVKGTTMTLTVKLVDSDKVLDSFTLQRDGSGRVFRCK